MFIMLDHGMHYVGQMFTRGKRKRHSVVSPAFGLCVVHTQSVYRKRMQRLQRLHWTAMRLQLLSQRMANADILVGCGIPPHEIISAR